MPDARPHDRDATLGVAVAAALIVAWAGHLAWWFSRPEGAVPWALAPLAALLQTWLHTGLFITAHDAMHGTLAPRRPRLNAAVGSLALALYAAFPYAALAREHRRHHASPASPDDPDYHDGARPGFARWYLRFVGHYLRWWQVAAMALAFNVLQHGLGVSQRVLLALWVAPSLLSTVQLFYFGTYRPHHDGGGFADAHRARSSGYGALASLVTCFHFGYHWEHHARPGVAWWRLPGARRALQFRS